MSATCSLVTLRGPDFQYARSRTTDRKWLSAPDQHCRYETTDGSIQRSSGLQKPIPKKVAETAYERNPGFVRSALTLAISDQAINLLLFVAYLLEPALEIVAKRWRAARGQSAQPFRCSIEIELVRQQTGLQFPSNGCSWKPKAKSHIAFV